MEVLPKTEDPAEDDQAETYQEEEIEDPDISGESVEEPEEELEVEEWPVSPPEYLLNEINDQAFIQDSVPPPGLAASQPSYSSPEMPTEKEDPSIKWQRFVQFVEKTGDKSLVSLLRNSVVLKMTENNLVIGLQNSALFSEEKRKQVEISANEFFNCKMLITYKDSVEGIDDPVTVKLEQERKRKIEEIKNNAAKSEKVQQILSFFPNSKIKNIEILEENEDV